MSKQNQNTKHTFLIADDHSIVRQGIALIIEEHYQECEIHQASSISQIKKYLLDGKQFSIVILDNIFQDGNGFDIIREIKEYTPETKILIFSSTDEHTYAMKFIERGADGFLNKLSDEETIIVALKSIVEKGNYFSPIVQELFIKKIQNPHFDEPLYSLSERELEVAKLYAEGLGNLEIANQLDIKQNTVSTLKKRIFEKLNISNMVELIKMFNQ